DPEAVQAATGAGAHHRADHPRRGSRRARRPRAVHARRRIEGGGPMSPNDLELPERQAAAPAAPCPPAVHGRAPPHFAPIGKVRFRDILYMALFALRGNWLRSILTALGV